MSVVLSLAGVYNLAWGSWAIAFPEHSFANSGMTRPGVPLHYPELWQCIGMIVGVYGIGYAIAGTAPARHWPIVLVGLLGKIFGPIGLAYGVARGTSPATGLYTCVPNDLIWWVPFTLILLHARRTALASREAPGAA